MKKALAITAIAAFMGMVAAQPALAGRIADRHFKQDKRISQGIKSGELTRQEARLERKQDRSSANIYRLKHNNRDRN